MGQPITVDDLIEFSAAKFIYPNSCRTFKQDVQGGRSKRDVPSGTSTLQGLSGAEVTDPSSPELLSEPDHRQVTICRGCCWSGGGGFRREEKRQT
ncbi:uncharacterized protein LOC130520045 [Takifugu flavidus]|uniref:uncharacterized protein LOC130520045 n=1 Tax=Takifugu flavidus TaxID=433684 RepID=UPI002543FD7A|nr:uncharacterized protein LOC130520045 [Takifugu flavidus]